LDSAHGHGINWPLFIPNLGMDPVNITF